MLDQAMHLPGPLPRAPRRAARAAGDAVVLAVVAGLATGTLVVAATLMGNL